MNWKLIWAEITASLSAKQGTNSKGHNHQLMKSCTFIQAMKTVWVTHKYPDHLIKKGYSGQRQKMNLTNSSGCVWTESEGSQGNEFCRQLAHFSSALADKLKGPLQAHIHETHGPQTPRKLPLSMYYIWIFTIQGINPQFSILNLFC